ncbi:aminoglycoside phosphotransferase family protein [Plantibacter sp. YIM 135347]|uniref:aminoglycoside phosphotransferase family protein n=1 Tax=Plantibacter sp. YIM 135347 TaxID=3423919 RepID=UPI003D352246
MRWAPGNMQESVDRWGLVPDGERFSTRSSELLPVLHDGRPAMLKVALVEEEALGGFVLAAWDGHGAAQVFEADEHAVVVERAVSGRDLAALTADGRDLDAVGILCDTLATLHAGSAAALRRLDERVGGGTGSGHHVSSAARPEEPTERTLPAQPVPLRTWFRDLATRAAAHPDDDGGFWTRAWEAADRRLSATSHEDIVLLHGDLHHKNVLEFAAGDWRAIDPKAIIGHRAFDYTNIFCNPDAATAADPELFLDRVALVSARARIDRGELLEWIIAWSGLSAAWHVTDGRADRAAEIIGGGSLAELALARVRR